MGEFQLLAQLSELAIKAERLAGLYADARARVDQLERANTALQDSLREQQAQVRHLLKKEATPAPILVSTENLGKIVNDNPAAAARNAELKQQLDEYIREIDRCLAHLHSLS